MTNLVRFYNETTSLMDENCGDCLLDFANAFDTVPHKIFTEKMLNYELVEHTMWWIKNWLKSWTQRVLLHSARGGKGLKKC